MLEQLTATYGEQVWEPRLDPTSELILTILTQNTADTNAEKAYEALRARLPQRPRARGPSTRASGWGGDGLSTAPPPDWTAVEFAPLPELIDVIRPGGLGPQKAPRLQATLRHIREQRGDYSLEFLGDLPALEARDWLTHRRHRQEDRVDRARVLLRAAPDGRRPPRRAGLASASGCCRRRRPRTRRTTCTSGCSQPDEMYAAHVLLIHHGRAICHAQNPKHDLCPVATAAASSTPRRPDRRPRSPHRRTRMAEPRRRARRAPAGRLRRLARSPPRASA